MKIFYVFWLTSYFVFAQVPSYYQGVDFTKTGNDLKSELSQLMFQTHLTYLPYTSSFQDDTWDAIRISDLNNDGSDNVLLIYGFNDADGNYQTDRTRDKMLTCHTSSCSGLWTREHVFPRSLGTPDLGTEFAGADLFNLRSCDAWRNNSRSNRQFEDAPNTVESYVISADTYYPGEEWRGDIARIIMYMYVRYPDQCAATSVGFGPATFSVDMPNVFLKWNAEDPVSPHEMTRNQTIFGYQGNRNPFIDNPYLATVIWGGQPAVDTWNVLNNEAQNIDSLVVYPTVTSNFIYISNADSSRYDIKVFNTLGQIVQAVDKQNQINLSQNASGVYFLRISNESSSKTFKVMLQ